MADVHGKGRGCTARHPDAPMVCVLEADHDGDHSVAPLDPQRRWKGKPIRETWPRTEWPIYEVWRCPECFVQVDPPENGVAGHYHDDLWIDAEAISVAEVSDA